MLKVSAADLPHVLDHFAGTFETLWQAVEFETYDRGMRCSGKAARGAAGGAQW